MVSGNELNFFNNKTKPVSLLNAARFVVSGFTKKKEAILTEVARLSSKGLCFRLEFCKYAVLGRHWGSGCAKWE